MVTTKETQEISFTVKFWTRKITQALGNKKNLQLRQYENHLEVWFYSTCIARIDSGNNILKLGNGGWETKTTKSHLNQILKTLALPWQVQQKKFQWYLGEREFNNEIEIEANLN